MQKTINEFLNKKITSKELLVKLEKSRKLFNCAIIQEMDLINLIKNIRELDYIYNEEEKYTKILVLLNRYNRKKRIKKSKGDYYETV